LKNSQLCLCKYHLQKALTEALGYWKRDKKPGQEVNSKEGPFGVKEVLDNQMAKAWMDDKKR